jgi:uncharacterized protein (UPF0276 family)
MDSHDSTQPISRAIGIGLRSPHVDAVLSTRPPVGWFEIHAENYLGGGASLVQLDAIRRDYPVSLHAVGLSLGSAEGIDGAHLGRLAELAQRIVPCLISDHLSWSVSGGVYLNDLLPLPYTEEALAIVARNIDAVQAAIQRPLLVENPSTYLRLRHSTIAEPEFLAELVRRTGCRLLCDVNNIHVSCSNFGLDEAAYIDALPAYAVAEIHLAGHEQIERGGRALLIDTHGTRVAAPVWDLYRQALLRFGLIPSLIEWDTDIPDLSVLIDEGSNAARIAENLATIHADAA